MWKLCCCVVFFFLVPIECLGTFSSLWSGWSLSIQKPPTHFSIPPAPSGKSATCCFHVIFHCQQQLRLYVCRLAFCFAFMMMIFQLVIPMFAFRQRLWQYIKGSSISISIPISISILIALELGLLYAFIGYMKIFSTLPCFPSPRPQLSATEVMKYFSLFFFC